MKCPVCRVPTYVVEHQEIEIDLCPDCRGVWFDQGELDLLLDGRAVAALTAAASDEAERPCPLCNTSMVKVNIGPSHRVLIDSCPQGCGLWFDDDELSALVADLQDDGWGVQPQVREFLQDLFPMKGEE